MRSSTRTHRRSARKAAASALVAALLVAGGCHDGTSPAGVEDREQVPAAPGFDLQQVSQDETPDPWAVADVVPGFAGYFLDGDRPVVSLTDPAERPAAEQALSAWLSSRDFSESDLIVREARYDWRQLDAWHEAAWPAALSVSGAILSDIDEGANRLRFGGVDASAVSAMTAAVLDAGVPGEAFVVEEVPAVVVRTGAAAPALDGHTLQDRVRPVVGGYQINFVFFLTLEGVATVGPRCTLGFNAVPEGPEHEPNPSFITNSHCSEPEGDGANVETLYYQPKQEPELTGLTDSENFIGTEADDPAMTVSADCPVLLPCRWSDAARAEYADGVPFDLGKIARPAAFDPVAGTLEVDAKKPTFTIRDEQPLAVLGETVFKVGRTTGWTGGEVTATCVNVLALGGAYVRRCQAFVAAGSDGGDSGSPVFTFTNRRGNVAGGHVILNGILWGGNIDGPPEFVYSPLFNVERELGLLTTH